MVPIPWGLQANFAKSVSISRPNGKVDGGHVLVAMAELDRTAKLLAYRLRDAWVRPRGPPGGGDQTGVLGGADRLETRRRLTLDHRSALQLRVRRVERSALDRLEEQTQNQTKRLGQRDGLADRRGQGRGPAVGDEL